MKCCSPFCSNLVGSRRERRPRHGGTAPLVRCNSARLAITSQPAAPFVFKALPFPRRRERRLFCPASTHPTPLSLATTLSAAFTHIRPLSFISMASAAADLRAQAPAFAPSSSARAPPASQPGPKGGKKKVTSKPTRKPPSEPTAPREASAFSSRKRNGNGKARPQNPARDPSLTVGQPQQTEETAPGRTTSSRPFKGNKGKRRERTDTKAPPDQVSQPETAQPGPSPSTAHHPTRSGRGKMNTKLTGSQSGGQGSNTATGATSSLIAPLQDDYPDLRSRLVAELSNGAYECVICCAVVGVRSAVWSCERCSTILHLKCAQLWSRTNLAQATDSWRATHPEQDPATAPLGEISWRCPGCQTTNSKVPTKYTCWCGRVTNPDHTASAHAHPPGAIRVPHGCGKPCPKGQCDHGCPTLCHPAACPPCPIVVTRQCFCGRQTISARCSQLSCHQTGPGGISCGATCDKPLACGSHACTRPCHAGPCGECGESYLRQCYCGKHTRIMACGQGEAIHCTGPSANEDVTEWEGYFSCDEKCARPYACGVHTCEDRCHVHGMDAGVCTRDPSVVLSCPCGASSHRADSSLKKVQDAVFARSHCTDPIPTCSSPCRKSLPCGHMCSATCHEGACPACREHVTRPCRCGASTVTRACCEWSVASPSDEIDAETGQVQPTCKVVCGTPLSCGKHFCTRPCCPLAFLNPERAGESPTHYRRSGLSAADAIAAAERHALLEEATAVERESADPLGLHNCPVVCGKPLNCGQHNCERTCHRGACGRCLNASFEEVSCACGRTVLEPPVPCGMVVACRLPCHRPPPPCGHPKVAHQCHSDDQACPPCVYLTTKQCRCGKSQIANVPCSRDRSRINCSKPCDEILNCGYQYVILLRAFLHLPALLLMYLS